MSDQLQTNLGYTFKRHSLLKHAVTHASFVHEQKLNQSDSNERLEFLGDAVLELCISDFLYHRYPDMPEGDLTKKRAALVCESSLANLARSLSIGTFILLGQGEATEGGREKDSILSDVLESILGAIYLDGGLEEVRALILRLYEPIADKALNNKKDYKTTLQEYLQKTSHETAVYTIIKETGPAHKKLFTAQAAHKTKILGTGKGGSKKTAEQEAARMALKGLKVSV
ncbi:MAG: ribonuclease III [Defluviitaleaceae bacterium]|nr:ribonuclease III [Defluviitaleaceae bacterium]MCL2261719.1 ribonuclease III [Defluviitaleaceae bacterium]